MLLEMMPHARACGRHQLGPDHLALFSGGSTKVRVEGARGSLTNDGSSGITMTAASTFH